MVKGVGASSKASRLSGSRTVRSARRNVIGTKRTVSAAGFSKSNASWTRTPATRHFVICVDAAGNEDIQVRRVYETLPDPSAARSHMLRIIDDSGEDYLYPSSSFLSVPLPAPVREALEDKNR